MARFEAAAQLDTTLREYLISEERLFYECAVKAVPDLPHPSTSALENAGPYRFFRCYLPDGHAGRRMGDSYDMLELGEDDILRLVV